MRGIAVPLIASCAIGFVPGCRAVQDGAVAARKDVATDGEIVILPEDAPATDRAMDADVPDPAELKRAFIERKLQLMMRELEAQGAARQITLPTRPGMSVAEIEAAAVSRLRRFRMEGWVMVSALGRDDEQSYDLVWDDTSPPEPRTLEYRVVRCEWLPDVGGMSRYAVVHLLRYADGAIHLRRETLDGPEADVVTGPRSLRGRSIVNLADDELLNVRARVFCGPKFARVKIVGQE